MSDGSATLVHIAAPKHKHEHLREILDEARDVGMFSEYDIILTENDATVTVADIDALADAVAKRVKADE